MSFSQLVDRLVSDTTQTSLGLFRPELALCGTILALLLVRLFSCDRWLPAYAVALTGTIVAFLFAFNDFLDFRVAGNEALTQPIFTGLLMFDKLTAFFRLFLLLFLVFVVVLTVFSGIPDDEDGPDFYALLVGSAIGMMIMASANNLLMLFVGVEMASVPSYAMVGFLKGRKQSSEAALKFVVYGAGAAGVMLYGVSLVAGVLGTGDMALLGERFRLVADASGEGFGISNPTVLAVALGLMMLMVGIAFKLSLFPFHFWAPDAFEGASAEVAGYLSVASKGAAFVLLIRVCLAFVGTDPGPLGGLFTAFGVGIGVIAIVTTTFGNLAAYTQTNAKRLLAYSTIAHAGYMLLAVSAMVVCLSSPDATPEVRTTAVDSVGGLLYYLFVYLFMNLGAFAVIAIIRNQIFSEEIADYAGLSRQAPLLAVCMLICAFSLIGLPPVGGFIGKFLIFKVLFEAGSINAIMYVLLVLAGLNTVFSLFYYLKLLKPMFLEERPPQARRIFLPSTSGASLFVFVIAVPVVLLGVYVEPLARTATSVARVILP